MSTETKLATIDALLASDAKGLQETEKQMAQLLDAMCNRQKVLGIAIISAPAPQKRAPGQRYRFQGHDEKKRLAEIHAQTQGVNAELLAQADGISAKAQEQSDPEMKSLAAELKKLEAARKQSMESLRGPLLILGFTHGGSYREILEYRSQLLTEKENLEKQKARVTAAADDKAYEEMADETKATRSLSLLASDIKASTGWLTMCFPGCSAREFVYKIKASQERGDDDFKRTEHVFVYSTNGSQMVHWKRTKNLTGKGHEWNPLHYYESCTAQEAQKEADKVHGVATKAPKDAGPLPSDWTSFAI